MQLYKTTDSNANTKPTWVGSQADAGKARVAMKATLRAANYPANGVDTAAVDVPTNKTGLLAFLNTL